MAGRKLYVVDVHGKTDADLDVPVAGLFEQMKADLERGENAEDPPDGPGVLS